MPCINNEIANASAVDRLILITKYRLIGRES